MLRLFARAVRRAGLPVAYSQGYNPRPKIWLLLPRPLGVSCLDELLLVGLSEDYSVEELGARLAQVLPAGIKLRGCFKLSPGLAPQPISVVYILELSPQDAAKMTGKIPALLDSASLDVHRFSRRKAQFREVDIRPYLSQMRLDQTELSFTLNYTPAGSAKPAEVLALLDLDNLSNRAKLIRTKVTYSSLQADQLQPKINAQETFGREHNRPAKE